MLRIEDARIHTGDEFAMERVADIPTAYALIAEDLKEAIPNLPVTQDTKYEATKGAAQALLCKVYLYHATFDNSKFAEAASVLNQVIGSKQYSLVTGADYVKLFEIEGENGKESVFEIQYNSLKPAGWTCITCSTEPILQNSMDRALLTMTPFTMPLGAFACQLLSSTTSSMQQMPDVM